MGKAEARPFQPTPFASKATTSGLVVVAAVVGAAALLSSSTVSASVAGVARDGKDLGHQHGYLHGEAIDWLGEGESDTHDSSSSGGGGGYYLRSASAFHRFLQAPNSTTCTNPDPSKIRGIFVVNQPVPIGITVDGLTSDWDLSTTGFDFVSNVTNAGNADTSASNYIFVGRLYLRWSCVERKLCALLLANDGYCLSGQADYFFKDYGISSNSITPLSPGFKDVIGTSGSSAGNIVGWEACFGPTNYAPPVTNLCRTGSNSNGNGVEFHADFGTCGSSSLGNTVSSGRGNDFIGLDLSCPCIAGADGSVCTVPPPFPQTPYPTNGTCCGDTCTPPDQACFCSCTSSITCPANVTIECGASTAPTANATVSKSGTCSSAITAVNYTDSVSTTSGVCPSKITRTWTASLKCTATGAVGRTHSCVQEISVKDTTKPSLYNVPADATLECTDPAAVTVTANDTCTGPITPILNTSSSPGCGTTKNVTRTWIATDLCGNSVNASQLTWIRDTTNPRLINVPDNTTASCDAIPPVAIVSANDTCDPSVTPTFNETNNTVVGQCQAGSTITRTWNAMDDCFNSDTKVQVITLTDTVNPTFTTSTPEDKEVSCDAALPPFGDLNATDSCGSATVSKSEVNTTGSCPQNVTVTRSWTATDLCGNNLTVSQHIRIYDSEKPELHGEIANGTFSCESIPSPPAVTASDNCASVSPVFSEVNSTSPGQCLNGASITRTWSVTDPCGNSDSKVQVVSITDNVNPTFSTTAPEDKEVSCDAALPPFDDLNATDSCGSATVSKSEVNSTGSCPQNVTVTRSWTATDLCGNNLTVSQHIRIYDSEKPELHGEIANGTFSCESIPGPPAVTASDNCASVSPVFSEVNSTSPGQCLNGASITRTWSVTDPCGNSDSKVQVVSITDNVNPTFTTTTPEDKEVSCEATLPPFGDLNATDSCGSATVSKSEVNTTGSCPQNVTVTRSWTATDLCGNNLTVSQHIRIYDDTNPTLSGVPDDTSVSCDAIPNPPTVTASDTCDKAVAPPSFNELSNVVEGQCKAGKVINRTWSSSDHCGNQVTQSQIITLTDTKAPRLYGLPANASVECSAIPLAANVTGNDTCGGDVTITMVETNTSGVCGNRSIQRVWTGVDVCLNPVSYTQVLKLIDTTKPSISCPANATVSCTACTDATATCVGIPTVSDNCDASPNVTYVDTYSPASLPNYSTTDVNQIIMRTYTVRDDCSNSNTCAQKIVKTGVLSEVTVKRTINGAVDSTADITIELYKGPANGGYSGTLLTSASTFGDTDGVVLDVFLNPSVTYTVCERNVPAGWSTNVTANGAVVVPYNADAATNQSLGNYCFDFQPTDCSATFSIVIDNVRGGGCPRTPGYWKNWNNCSGGRQGITAAKNGGAAKGYYIVEDLLPIVWDDMNNDSKFFSIKNCTAAVQVLSSKTLSGCLTSPNTQFASDPVIALAKNLLATQLNLKASACSSSNVTQTSKLAEKLLDDLNYLGCKLSTTPNATTTALLRTYSTILDGYNNGNSCPGCNG